MLSLEISEHDSDSECLEIPSWLCFCRCRGDEMAWYLLGSHNLSKAAWGAHTAALHVIV